ncbi:MAG TPA: response regulator [Methylophilaceae bacterium]|jgi:FixJ family two-component response regulator
MNSQQIIVYIVDDDAAVRDALTLMIKQEGIAVKAYASAKAFLSICQPDSSGCVIIDVKMPGMDGTQLQTALVERGVQLPIIFLTGHGDIPMSVRAIKAGAVDFLTKPITREKLLASVRQALQENERILTRTKGIQECKSSLERLTKREREVMTLAIAGHHNKELARVLGISHRTVEIYKSNIMHKTGAINLIDLARIGRIAGLEE